jgi:hypothetical protein
VTRTVVYVPSGFEKANKGTVTSFITPNATCPKCKQKVWFYRSPYNGRVYFDDIGWPWPKHSCMDTRRNGAEPRWQRDGWQVLLASRVHSDGDRLLLTGDADNSFLELNLPSSERIDKDSPVFVRRVAGKPGLYEATFLQSDAFQTFERKSVAFGPQLTSVGDEALLKAAAGDPVASYAVALSYLSDENKPNVNAALPYLQAAASKGHLEALVELALISLLWK